METDESRGRVLGMLMLYQMIASAVVNFVILDKVFAPPGFLVNGAAHATGLGVAVLSLLASGLAWIGSAVVTWPVFRRRSPTLAMLYLGIATMCAAIIGVEAIGTSAMLPASRAYAQAAVADQGGYVSLRYAISGVRNGAHLTELVISGACMLVLYAMLFRGRLVPRFLAGAGFPVILLQMVTVARPLFGGEVVFGLLAPLGIVHLLVTIALLARGFPRETAAPA